MFVPSSLKPILIFINLAFRFTSAVASVFVETYISSSLGEPNLMYALFHLVSAAIVAASVYKTS
ncbi:hypothetical protein D3C86_1982520 [compost metagenome]